MEKQEINLAKKEGGEALRVILASLLTEVRFSDHPNGKYQVFLSLVETNAL